MPVVYRSSDNWFFSDGVKREFGQNKFIKPLSGEAPIFSSVMPLKCEPLINGLELFGTIDEDI